MKSLDELNEWIDRNNAIREIEIEERVKKIKNFVSENKDLVGKIGISLAGCTVSYALVELSNNLNECLSVGFEGVTVLKNLGYIGTIGSAGYCLLNAGKLTYNLFKKK
jgi:hypothetical protein